MSRETQHLEPDLQRSAVVRYASQYSAIRSATQTPGQVLLSGSSLFAADGFCVVVVVVLAVVVVAIVVVVGRRVEVGFFFSSFSSGPSMQHFMLGDGHCTSSRTS